VNEQIKQLAEQAEVWNADGDKCEVDLEKFAELIMQDMHKKVIASILITDVVMEEKGLIPTAEDYILAINKDFGVEE
jgi:hypothetical protein